VVSGSGASIYSSEPLVVGPKIQSRQERSMGREAVAPMEGTMITYQWGGKERFQAKLALFFSLSHTGRILLPP